MAKKPAKQEKAKIPDFVQAWWDSYSEGVPPENQDEWDQEYLDIRRWLCDEVTENDPDWERVSREFSDESKYNNVFEVVLRHRQSNRFIRFFEHTLPYGITDYGMEPEDKEIEEVWPYRQEITTYRTREEHRRFLKFQRSNSL